MNIHIPYLDALIILCAAIFPTGLGANIGVLLQKYKSRSIVYSLLGMLIAYAVLIGILLLQFPGALATGLSVKPSYLLVALLCAGVCYGVELSIGALIFYLKSGRFPKRVAVHNAYSAYQQIRVADYLAVVAYVVMEELILRTVIYNILRELGMENVTLIILIMTIVYAVNHISFGNIALLQKLFSGWILSCLYIFTGECILYPIIAHGVYNVSLVILSGRKRGNHG